MEHYSLKGQVREASNKAAIKAFRREGLVPCNIYGQGIDNVLFTVSEKDLNGLIFTPQPHIIDLELDNGKKCFAVLHELQFHPVKDNCLHADFLVVTEDKPIAINVPITFTGHSIGVRKGGKFFKVSRTLKISALMADLPNEIKVDITKLRIGKRIVAADLSLKNINIISPKTTILCAVKVNRKAVVADDEEEEEEGSEETPASEEKAAE